MIDTRRVIQLLMADGHTAADVMVWIASRQEATLRDEFAAHAVAGVLQMVATGQHELGVVRPTGAAGIAHSAYEIADAMIAARTA
jgi:hypothetical protein